MIDILTVCKIPVSYELVVNILIIFSLLKKSLCVLQFFFVIAWVQCILFFSAVD